MKLGRFLAILALTFMSALSYGQEGGFQVDYNHPRKFKVGGVAVEGNTYYSDQQIVSASGLVKGMDVTVPSDDISAVVQRLWLRRYFEDVAVTVDSLSAAGDSAFFTIRIKERPRVSRWIRSKRSADRCFVSFAVPPYVLRSWYWAFSAYTLIITVC